MNLLKRLAISGGVLLSILGGAKATPFFNPINLGNNYITLEGRLSFLDNSFQGPAKTGDELGIFRWPVCIGSSGFIDENQSHYFNLKIYNGAIKYILNGSYDVKAYKFETNSLWDVRIMGYSLPENNIHFQAFNPVYVPEPSTIAIFGAGFAGLYLTRNLRKRK